MAILTCNIVNNFTCRCVGNIVTDVNIFRDTEMLTCRRVGNIVTDVNKHRDTAILECRRVGNIVSEVKNHRDTVIRNSCFFQCLFFDFVNLNKIADFNFDEVFFRYFLVDSHAKRWMFLKWSIWTYHRQAYNKSFTQFTVTIQSSKQTYMFMYNTYICLGHTYIHVYTSRIHVCIHVLCTHVCNDVHIAMCARSLERTYLFTYMHTCMYALTTDVGLFVYCICVCR